MKRCLAPAEGTGGVHACFVAADGLSIRKLSAEFLNPF